MIWFKPKKLHIVIVVCLFLLGCAAQPKAVEPAAMPQLQLPADVQQAADTYRSLRQIKSNFEGGEWVEDVDNFGGAKHSAMILLADFVDKSIKTGPELITLMGEPDAVIAPGDELFLQIQVLPEIEQLDTNEAEYVVYYWRGVHDFLFFQLSGEEVITSGWWMAYE